ncbi:hypothetical protein OF117_20660 [Geodermatophilus sp. YIM 151500]|uniref:hypothetical protein n=1 Tax=Geodermatophilus sp. YIM 151500 TaxID=2984531 RepID=UPI0021E4484B|nr:hypothetical protein [Geodermatophilus sp. YIM 151500]MCV2491762.1 hypothetical protein [Geodermatophilus sp. YIM 151500]
MLTVALAWTAALAVCMAAALFGQTARAAPRRTRRAGPGRRIGLLLSLSGPWLALLGAVALGALTGAWLPAAALAAGAVVVVALAGLVLAPR